MKERIGILGAGESGVGAALLANKLGYDVWVSDKGAISDSNKMELDQAGIAYEEGQHTLSEFDSVKTIVKSPGIPDHIQILKDWKEQGKEIISEIEFAFRNSSGKIVGITGSNGKTTTTSLIGHLLVRGGLDVAVVGNIGKSFARQVYEHEKEVYVIELSSFQLDGITSFRPDVAVLLNITPDHLDRYDYKFENYVESKFRIAKNQKASDFFIYNYDDEAIRDYMKNEHIASTCLPFSINEQLEQGAWANTEEFFIHVNKLVFGMNISDLSLSGQHNLQNSMASSVVGRIFDLRKEVIRESLSDFRNLEHRMEFVGKIKGVEYINDSKATNVNATWYALESQEKPTIWIVGGVDKGNDYSALVDLVDEKVKAIICLGEDNLKIHQAFSSAADLIVNTMSMEEAVGLANHLGVEGDSVLMSPACASFDLFENYEHRGAAFKNVVRSL